MNKWIKQASENMQYLKTSMFQTVNYGTSCTLMMRYMYLNDEQPQSSRYLKGQFAWSTLPGTKLPKQIYAPKRWCSRANTILGLGSRGCMSESQ